MAQPRRSHPLAVVMIVLLGACAGAPPRPSPNTGTVWGYVRLLPPEGAPQAPQTPRPYADRGLRDAKLVDYSHPGPTVVYLEGRPSPAGTARAEIRATRFGVEVDPRLLVVGAGGTIVLANETDSRLVVSSPAIGVLFPIEPGREVAIQAEPVGESSLHLLDRPGEEIGVFVSPGPFCVPTPSGRFELRDLPPGAGRLCTWHRRSPPTARAVEVLPGAVQRIDLEMGARKNGTENDAQ